MDRFNLNAQDREVLGKKVKKLRQDGLLPGHVFGKGLETEHVSVDEKQFLKVFHEAGETGLIDLKIGEEKIRPVLIREIQYDLVEGNPIHVDFYQVNLKEKVRVQVPLVLIGEEPEAVHLGEAIVLQTMNEVEVEALPTDLVENLEIDQSKLKKVDDAITLGDLNYDKEKLTIDGEEDEVVAKLAPAVSEEMEELLEEQEAETAEAAAEAEGEAEGEQKEEGGEGEAPEGGVDEAAPTEDSGDSQEKS